MPTGSQDVLREVQGKEEGQHLGEEGDQGTLGRPGPAIGTGNWIGEASRGGAWGKVVSVDSHVQEHIGLWAS